MMRLAVTGLSLSVLFTVVGGLAMVLVMSVFNITYTLDDARKGAFILAVITAALLAPTAILALRELITRFSLFYLFSLLAVGFILGICWLAYGLLSDIAGNYERFGGVISSVYLGLSVGFAWIIGALFLISLAMTAERRRDSGNDWREEMGPLTSSYAIMVVFLVPITIVLGKKILQLPSSFF